MAEDQYNQETKAVKGPSEDVIDQTVMKPKSAAEAVAANNEKRAAMRAAKGKARAMATGGPVTPQPGNTGGYQPFSQPAAAAAQPQEAASSPAPEAAPSDDVVNVIDPDGNLVGLPKHQVHEAFLQGYQPATDAHIDQYMKQQAYGGAGQGAVAGLEGAADAATFGLSSGLETSLGLAAPEDIAGREEEHPIARMGGQLAGLGASMATGAGAGAAMDEVGALAASKTGAGAAAAYDAAQALKAAKASGVGVTAAQTAYDASLGSMTLGAKVGSAAVKAAAENALFQGGDEIHKYFSDQADPNIPVQSAAVDMLGAGLIGGALGGAGSLVSPLWKATIGTKLGGVLGAIQDRLGGVEGVVPGDVDQSLSKLGIQVAPEVRAAMSDDPAVKQLASVLGQTDSNGSGLAFQKTTKEARSLIIDSIARTMGSEPEDLSGEFSRAEAGTKLGTALSDRFKALNDRDSEAFESNSEKYGGAELSPSVADRAEDVQNSQAKVMNQINKATRDLQKALKANDVEGAISHSAAIQELQTKVQQLGESAKIPGTTDQISHKIGSLVADQGWGDSEEIMKQVQKTMDKLPKMQTVSDIQKEMTRLGNVGQDLKGPIGQNTSSSRAMFMLRDTLKEAEQDSIGRAIGSEEGEDALEKYKAARKNFAATAKLKEFIDGRLNIGGSVSGYGKSIAMMVKDDPEGILRKLSGANDAPLLNFLQENFPNAADALRQNTQQEILSKAVRAAKAGSGDKLNPTTIRKALADMAGKSPELRDFVFPGEIQGKLDASAHLLEKMNDPAFNFSNTARTADKLGQHFPGSAMGLISMLTGHGVGESIGIGTITKYIGKDIPDAARLATLKFLGSTKPVEPGAFQSMVKFMKSTIRGENMIDGAVKGLFKTGRVVLPTSAIATARDNDRLEKHIETLQDNPTALMENAGQGLGHYMPNHAQAMAQTASNVAQHLSSIKPQPHQSSPLDTPRAPSKIEEAKWHNALTIANQPLTVMQKIRDGALTSEDVGHANAMYPQLMSNLRQRITNEVANRKAGDEPIPYKQRLSMSLFMGQPLDSTMTPQGIMGAQPQNPQAPQPNQAQGSKGTGRHDTKAIGKLGEGFQTASQKLEAGHSSSS